MLIGEVAERAGVTVKAVRYYESLGLLQAPRRGNGYRDFVERDVKLVREIRELGALGVRAEQARPFLDCLLAGHEHGSDCPDAVTAYREAIAELDDRITELAARRAAIAQLLAAAEPRCEFTAAGAR